MKKDVKKEKNKMLTDVKVDEKEMFDTVNRAYNRSSSVLKHLLSVNGLEAEFLCHLDSLYKEGFRESRSKCILQEFKRQDKQFQELNTAVVSVLKSVVEEEEASEGTEK